MKWPVGSLCPLFWLLVALSGTVGCSSGTTTSSPARGADSRSPLRNARERHWMVQGVPHAHVLVAVGAEPSEAERAEVTALVARHQTRRDTFDLSLLEDYVEAHPDSPYAPSLHFAIGLATREMARYQDTLTHLDAAWRSFKGAQSTLAREQADRVIAELAVMHAQLGHRETLRTLFASLRTRPPLGVSAERINHAWEGLSMMENEPGRAYLCGPLALRSVWRASHENRLDVDPRIAALQSTHQGTNLAQLAELASAVGMDLRAVRHPTGAPWASPMVVHWKVGHFAAIIDRHELGEGHFVYLLRDPTFGEDRWTTGAILDQEASGAVLASASDAGTASWPSVPNDEARATWGRGYTSGGNANEWGEKYRMAECGASGKTPRGMARRHLLTHLATLSVSDIPIWNNPAYGDALEFELSYNQGDWLGAPPWMSTLGPRWMHNWRGEIEIITTTYYSHGPPTNVGPSPPSSNTSTSIIIHSRRGGDVFYRATWLDLNQTLPVIYDYDSDARLLFHYDTNHNITSIDREFSDHTSETYTGSNGHFRLTTVRDAQGRSTSLVYRPGSSRLESVVAPSGTMTFHYDTDDPDAETFLLIRRVSIGTRQASFTYAHVPGQPTGDGGVGPAGPLMLASITDMAGITSYFEYGSVDRGRDPHERPDRLATLSIPDPTFLRYMRTPYGRTEFVTGWGLDQTDPNGRQTHQRRWLDVIYPGGERERLARQDYVEGACPATDTAHCFPDVMLLPPTFSSALAHWNATPTEVHYMNGRNSFYWSPEAFARARARNPSSTGAPEDWDLNIHDAHTFHWMHAPYDKSRSSSILESEEEAGEARVFYLYKSQNVPDSLDENAYNVPHDPSRLLTGVFRHVSDAGTPDQQDRTTRMTYNAEGRLESVTDDEGQKVVYSYTAGDLTRVVREVGGGVQELLAAFTYDPAHPHLPATVRNSANLVTSIGYNANHQITSITRPDSSVVTNVYDPVSARLTSVVTNAGTAQTTYNARGLPETTTSHEGLTRTLTYDDLDRVLTVTAPGSRTVTFDYRYRDADGALALNAQGNPFLALEATSVTGIDGSTSVRSFDALHRLRYSTTNGADPTYYAYDVADNGWFHRLELRRSSGGITVPTTQWSFPMGTGYSTRPTRLRRTAAGTHEDTTYAYNGAGELTSVTEPGATPTTFEYDEVGRTKRVCRDSMCADGEHYTYDVLRGRLTNSVTSHSGVSVDRGFTYGPATVVATPMPTASLPDADRVVEAREYTYAGATLTDSDTTTYGYDLAGRVAQAVHAGETLRYQYDTAGRFTGIVNDATVPPTQVLTQQYNLSATPRRPSHAYLPRTNCVRDFLYQSQADDHRMHSSWFFDTAMSQPLARTDLTYTPDGRLNSERDESIWRYFYYNLARRLDFHSGAAPD